MTRKTLVLSLLAGLLLSACVSRLEKNLDPESREFLSKVRFIITRGERQTLLQLPPSERQGFIQDFWKKRDPTPETEENEYKDTYFQRIEEANLLFRDGNEPGWIQDRGRIYILLGPPTNRETYPRGITFYGKPVEIWYYGYFPIWFIDAAWNGTYRLDPDSAQQLAEIMSVQMYLKPVVAPEKGALEFSADVVKKADGTLVARIVIPYAKIWFKAEGEKLLTTLALSLDITDAKETKVWTSRQDYALELTEKEL
ncbi:MAG: GWxTD domain-containing protein, partial [Candidatus Aminicenantes bacterium]|nr:GWxTD domain-containing protein [Candidatus Aminicenantes bacterium]